MKQKFIILLALSFILIILLPSFWFPQTKISLLEKALPISLFGQLLKEKEEPIVLIAVGDAMLGRSVNAKMRSLNDFTYPFLKTAQFLSSADLTFINLEAPFYNSCPTTNEGMKFCTDPRAIDGLVFAGIDVANLANNHIRNYGVEGVALTQSLLRENNIDFLSFEENFLVKLIRGTKFGFLGFNLTSGYQEEEIIRQIREEKAKVDILVVSFHWGLEYAQEPSSGQVRLAHQAVEAGANLILGHHSHVIQRTEDFQEAKIIYSLGNFVFDQPWSEQTKKGLVGIFSFQDKKLIKSEFKEVYIQNLCQPKFID